MDQQADDERLQAVVDCDRKVPLVPALCRSASISRRWAALAVPTHARNLGSCKCFLDLQADAAVEPLPVDAVAELECLLDDVQTGRSAEHLQSSH